MAEETQDEIRARKRLTKSLKLQKYEQMPQSDDNKTAECWICPCSGVGELIPKGSKCPKCGRSEPTSGKTPFVTRYW